MAELERSEAGAIRRAGLVEAGKESRHKREYGKPGIGDPGGFRYAEMARSKLGGGAGGKPRDIFADRKTALKQAYSQMETLFPADEISGHRINPATGKSFSESGYRKYAESMADSLLKYSGGGMQQARQQAGQLPESQGYGHVTTAGGRRWDVDESLPSGQQITRGGMARAGLDGGQYEIPSVNPKDFQSKFFPAAEEKRVSRTRTTDPRQSLQFGTPAAYKKPLEAIKRSFSKPIKKYTPRSYLQTFGNR